MTNRIAWGRVCTVILSCAATVAVSPAQTFTTLLSFDGTDGARPVSMALVQGVNGNFHGLGKRDIQRRNREQTNIEKNSH
jgi:hypothetical protein